MRERVPERSVNCLGRGRHLIGGNDVSHDTDWAWAAGFFDGEGSITVRPNGTSRHALTSRLSISQKERQPLERFRAVVGAGTIRSHGQRDMWVWQLNAKADVRRVVDGLWPYLSYPKRGQIFVAMTRFEAYQQNKPPRPNALKTHCPYGHEYTLENTRIQNKNKGKPSRSCKECERRRRRQRYGSYAAYIT